MDKTSPNGANHGIQGEGPTLSEFVKPTDEARAFPRPGGIDEFYIEKEYGAAEQEQIEAYDEKGELEAAADDAIASGLKHDADHAVIVSEQATELAKNAW